MIYILLSKLHSFFLYLRLLFYFRNVIISHQHRPHSGLLSFHFKWNNLLSLSQLNSRAYNYMIVSYCKSNRLWVSFELGDKRKMFGFKYFKVFFADLKSVIKSEWLWNQSTTGRLLQLRLHWYNQSIRALFRFVFNLYHLKAFIPQTHSHTSINFVDRNDRCISMNANLCGRKSIFGILLLGFGFILFYFFLFAAFFTKSQLFEL